MINYDVGGNTPPMLVSQVASYEVIFLANRFPSADAVVSYITAQYGPSFFNIFSPAFSQVRYMCTR